MTAPFGLTRAEAEREQQQPAVRVTVVAPPGKPTCKISVPPDGGACSAQATCRIVWQSRDGKDEPTLACKDCAERMEQLAASHRTAIRVEPL